MTSCASTLTAGSTPVFELTFYDGDGVLADPTSISVVHKAPDGTEWRISDHRLPHRDDKPGRGWSSEIVVDDWRERGLADYFDQMLRRGPYAE